MAITKSQKNDKVRATTAENAVKRMADFVRAVVDELGVELNAGRITKKTYENALNKLHEITTIAEEAEMLWNEVGFLEGYADELDKDFKRQIQEVKDYYENFIDDLEKEYGENVEKAYKSNATNLNSIYNSFGVTCQGIKQKLDSENVSKKVAELKDRIQSLTNDLILQEKETKLQSVRADRAEEDTEYAQSVAYDEYMEKKAIEKEYIELQAKHDALVEQIDILKETQSLKAKRTLRTSIITSARTRIETLERELDFVNNDIATIKRNLTKTLLYKEFGVPSSVSAGVQRSKAIGKAYKKAKRKGTLKEKVDKVTTTLQADYPDWFGEEFDPKNTQQNVREYVNSTLKSTLYRVPAMLKAGVALLLVSTTVATALTVASHAQNSGLDAKNKSQTNTISEQNEQILQKDGIIYIQKEELESQKNELSDKKNEIKNQNTIIADKEKENQDLSNKNDKLNQENNSLSNKNDKLNQENTDLSNKNDKLNQENTDLSNKNDKLNQENQDLSNKNDQLQQENTDLTNKNDQLQQENSDLSNKNESLKNEKDELQGKHDQLQQENDGLKQELADKDIPVLQGYAFTGESNLNKSLVSHIKGLVAGEIQNVAFKYDSTTGKLQMVSQVKKGKNVQLVVGESQIATGCRLDENSIQNYISSMSLQKFNKEIDGIFYNTTSASMQGVFACKVSACKVEYGADGSLLDIIQASASQAGVQVSEEEILQNVIQEILSHQTQLENE